MLGLRHSPTHGDRSGPATQTPGSVAVTSSPVSEQQGEQSAEQTAAARRRPSTAAPNPQPPVQQRVRLRYAKRGRMRFTSHRDIGRALERAVRRAAIPVAYSHGFHPHPRISYAGASQTGAASEAEYMEIGLHRRCDPEAVRSALDAALPAGIDVTAAIEAAGGSLADHLEASDWEMTLPGVGEEPARDAVATFQTADAVEVSRMTKKGLRTFDCRAAVVQMSVVAAQDPAGGSSCAILHVVLRHGTPSVRPDDVLAGLTQVGGLRPPVPPLLNRIAQGPLDPKAGTVGDPFSLDRDMPDANQAADIDRGRTAAASD